MCIAIIKGLRFADTLESCFEVWKRSHMGCSALLLGQFADSQESLFQASKRSNMGSAVLEDDHSVDIHEFCFKAAERSDMDWSMCKGVYLLIVGMVISGLETFR